MLGGPRRARCGTCRPSSRTIEDVSTVEPDIEGVVARLYGGR